MSMNISKAFVRIAGFLWPPGTFHNVRHSRELSRCCVVRRFILYFCGIQHVLSFSVIYFGLAIEGQKWGKRYVRLVRLMG